jgi:hypothetical protein
VERSSRAQEGREGASSALAPRAVAIIKELAETRRNECVFSGLKRGQPLIGMAMLMLRDMQPGITVHGFWSTF